MKARGGGGSQVGTPTSFLSPGLEAKEKLRNKSRPKLYFGGPTEKSGNHCLCLLASRISTQKDELLLQG
jgi:hypothetical protein